MVLHLSRWGLLSVAIVEPLLVVPCKVLEEEKEGNNMRRGLNWARYSDTIFYLCYSINRHQLIVGRQMENLIYLI